MNYAVRVIRLVWFGTILSHFFGFKNRTSSTLHKLYNINPKIKRNEHLKRLNRIEFPEKVKTFRLFFLYFVPLFFVGR